MQRSAPTDVLQESGDLLDVDALRARVEAVLADGRGSSHTVCLAAELLHLPHKAAGVVAANSRPLILDI
jgi:hypothetical protein